MLVPWKKRYDQPRQYIKKQRHYFPNKGSSSQSYGFSNSHVWMWVGLYRESWAPKNWCFWIVGLERLLRGPWTARRSNQSILKETSPEYSLEGLMLKLKLQYFGHLVGRADSSGKDPDAGKDWGQKGMTEDEMVCIASQTRWPWSLSRLRELVMDREAWHAAVCWAAAGQYWATGLIFSSRLFNVCCPWPRADVGTTFKAMSSEGAKQRQISEPSGNCQTWKHPTTVLSTRSVLAFPTSSNCTLTTQITGPLKQGKENHQNALQFSSLFFFTEHSPFKLLDSFKKIDSNSFFFFFFASLIFASEKGSLSGTPHFVTLYVTFLMTVLEVKGRLVVAKDCRNDVGERHEWQQKRSSRCWNICLW